MWPTPQDYNEAIQNPELCFRDPELAQSLPDLNALGLPRPISGSFASVYQMRSYSRNWAVRCFLRDVPDQAERYRKIGEHLGLLKLPCTVPFEYLPQGIKIGNRWFPVLKMEWVAGTPLIEWIEQHLDDPAALESMQQSLSAMCTGLRGAGIAHGDLQHGNLLVVGNHELKVVDYDGMFVPALQSYGGSELGHRHYQHPLRSHRHFADYLDNFSAWSIYTSLHCLIHDSRLWERLDAGDECLLFRQEDYVDPNNSIAFRYLEHHDSRVIQEAARTLRSLLSKKPEDIPPLGEPIIDREDLTTLEPPATPLSMLEEHGKIRVAYAPVKEHVKLVVEEDGDSSDESELPWYRQSRFNAPAIPVRVRSRRAPNTAPSQPASTNRTGTQNSGRPLITGDVRLLAYFVAVMLVSAVSINTIKRFYAPPSPPIAALPMPVSSIDFKRVPDPQPNTWYEEGLSFLASKQYRTAAEKFEKCLRRIDTFRAPNAAGVLDGLRMSSLALLKEEDGLGFAHYNEYLRFSPEGSRSKTAYSDLSQIAHELELKKNYKFAYVVWAELLTGLSEAPNPQSVEVRTMRASVLDAMSDNRKKIGDSAEAWRLEQEAKDVRDPKRPAISRLHDKQDLLERQYQELRKQYKM